MYVTPVVELVSLAAERQLLAGSGVTVTKHKFTEHGESRHGVVAAQQRLLHLQILTVRVQDNRAEASRRVLNSAAG